MTRTERKIRRRRKVGDSVTIKHLDGSITRATVCFVLPPPKRKRKAKR